LDLSLAYNYGRKAESNVQWVRASMFGDRAEKVCEHMKKGKQIYAEVDEVHIRVFEKDGEKRSALEGILQNFEFAGKKDD
jgi:single-stranded DNA-binding protein